MIGPPADRPMPLHDADGNLIPLRHKPHVRLADGFLDTPCWVALKILPRRGERWLHAYVAMQNRAGSAVMAHRWMWAFYHDREIPVGMVVHHRCFEKRCLNPQHLQLVTFGENSRLSNFEQRWAA